MRKEKEEDKERGSHIGISLVLCPMGPNERADSINRVANSSSSYPAHFLGAPPGSSLGPHVVTESEGAAPASWQASQCACLDRLMEVEIGWWLRSEKKIVCYKSTLFCRPARDDFSSLSLCGRRPMNRPVHISLWRHISNLDCLAATRNEPASR